MFVYFLSSYSSSTSSHSYTAKEMWSASVCFSWLSVKGSVSLPGRSSMRSVVHTRLQNYSQFMSCVSPSWCTNATKIGYLFPLLFFFFLYPFLSSVTQGLEYCEERYSQELSGSAFPLRAQATNTRLLSCQTIEKFRPHPDRDDSMNEGRFTWNHLQEM